VLKSPHSPFDAVLLIAFGGPNAPAEVRPFLETVTRGRPMSLARMEQVIHQYELVGGISPLSAIVHRQAEALCRCLHKQGLDLPVFAGMRHWHPFLADTFKRMAESGIRRAIGVIMATHHCQASCGHYKQEVLRARRSLVEQGLHDIEICYVDGWHDDPRFIKVITDKIRKAMDSLTPHAGQVRLVFTAHSIPVSMARSSRYVEEIQTTAGLVAEQLGHSDWSLVYQSRSGRPEDPWLEPDIGDYIRTERTRGLNAAVLVPIGFLADHIEVIYDLDHKAAAVAQETGLIMGRAETVNDHPLFIEMLADLTSRVYRRYLRFPPLPICGPDLLSGGFR